MQRQNLVPQALIGRQVRETSWRRRLILDQVGRRGRTAIVILCEQCARWRYNVGRLSIYDRCRALSDITGGEPRGPHRQPVLRTLDEAGKPPTGFLRAWRRSRGVRSRSRPARARALDQTFAPTSAERRRVTEHSEIGHGVRSPWSRGSRSRWPRSRSGSR